MVDKFTYKNAGVDLSKSDVIKEKLVKKINVTH